MKALVVFDTRHGNTRQLAQKLAKALGEGAETFELGTQGRAAIDKYDAIVLGGPVYAKSWSRRAAAFARDNLDALKEKRFAAFSSGYDIGAGSGILKAALPPELSNAAVALSGLGGAFVMSRMNAIERFILKTVAKVASDSSSVDEKAILDLASNVKGGSK
jgi:menaquinone-dependent protoporphyrinogen oxidase